MPIEHINKTDTLNEGREKINAAIDGANVADVTSKEADTKATQALANSESTQTQLDTIVIEGDSSVEAAQARVDEKGEGHATLKARIDDGFERTSSQLAETELDQFNMRNVINYELNSKTRRKQGIAVFTSDDSRVEDLTVGMDIFESVGVPQTLYLISEQIDKPGYLSREQCLMLQNELKWEMASHSRTHPAPFPNVTDGQARVEFRDSKIKLESLGLEINNYSYVGGNYGKRERLLAREYYRSARCSDRDNGGVNLPPLNTYELKTIWIDPETAPLKQYLADNSETEAYNKMRTFVKASIDKAHDVNGLLVISTHFININTPAMVAFYEEMVQYADSKLDVTTMNDALDKMGNIVDVGDYSQYGARSNNGTHFVIGADGVMSGSYSVTERDRFSVQNLFDDFPFGVTVVPLSYSNRTGTPEDYSGLLINYRFDDKEGSVNYQRYMSYRTKNEYIRYVEDNTSFGAWELDTMTLRDSVYTPLSKPSEFPSGVNVVRVTTNSVGLAQTPTGRRGKMINIKPEKAGESIAYNEQKYFEIETRDTYTRYADNDAWSGWVKDNLIKLPGYNVFGLDDVFNDFPLGITYSIIETGDSETAPNNRRGTLVTHKLTNNYQQAYSFQEYLSDNGDSFRRHPTSGTSWGAWF